ncbi:putative MFS multidrug transporter [Protomyces lactucae-debilis]|uniref:Putative MFS multidrug transporter n=1 Tax=Protomyces lactucae-debilis TaxID=2754530 RepID=A0A1Y2FDY5_PROLT|nr:putative MFS multidrug transporter [Protomyces lactucae-debilis]ORY82129.1 putative MFS multidrug transporter [Protomyces lactucae-debilis]
MSPADVSSQRSRGQIPSAETETTPLLNGSPRTEESATARGISSRRLALTIAAISCGTFLAAFDLTIVAAIWPTIGAEFNSLNQMAYVAVAYHLSNTAFQPLYGRLSDIFGRKQCLLFANAVFGIGTLGCALSRNLGSLVLSRLVAGIGGGGLNVVSVIILSDLVPVRRRGIFQGLMNIIFGSGSALGAPIGGLIADSAAGWRWAFGIQLPIIVLSMFMIWRLIVVKDPMHDTTATWQARVRRIDFIGSAMLVSAISCLIIGLNIGGNMVAWRSPIPLSLMAGFVIFAIAFILVEKNVASDPILAVRLMHARTPILTSICNFFSTTGYFILLFQLPLFYRATMHLSASGAGQRLIPGAVAGSSGSLAIGFLMTYHGSYYRFMLICSGLLMLGTTYVYSLDTHSSLFAQYTVLIPCGIGYGGFLTTTLIALLTNTRSEEMASATGMSYLFRAVGSIVGISASSNILNTLLGSRLTPVVGRKLTEMIKRDANVIWTLKKHERNVVLGVYVGCMHVLFATAIVLSVLTFLCAIAVERKSLKEEDAVLADPSCGEPAL